MPTLNISVDKGRVQIQALEVIDPDVAEFFNEAPVETHGQLAVRAFTLGVTGLRSVSVAAQAQVVEREFGKLKNNFASGLDEMEMRLLSQVDATFDPDRADSVSGKLSCLIAESYQGAAKALDEAKEEMGAIIDKTFDPDLTTSSVFRITALVNRIKDDLERCFDPAYEDGYLARISGTVDEYFGEDGLIGQVIQEHVAPVRDQVLSEVRELRDLVVAQSAVADLRRRSSHSGGDFEDEVEDALRACAQTYGDTVERVGETAGETGRSKKGDFVVQLAEGPRFTVEAKDRSKPVTLRGKNGILAALDDSMVNRNATFGIAVTKDSCGFPKEVGPLNSYDSDKILCCYEDDGSFVQVAYRWARAALLTSTTRNVDVDTVEAGLGTARTALREMNKIKGKADAILKGADEINAIVAWQVRKAVAALDEAESGLVTDMLEAG